VRNCLKPLLVALLWAWVIPIAVAHKASDSLLSFNVHEDTIDARWDISLRDLEYAIGVDTNLDGNITWGELRVAALRIQSFALASLEVKRGGALCRSSAAPILVDTHSDGTYAVLPIRFRCKYATGPLRIDYHLLFDLDPTHRGLAKVDMAGREIALVFSPEHPSATVTGTASNTAASFVLYIALGIRHILSGADHLLFLLSLLLAACATYGARSVENPAAPAQARVVFVSLMKVVTAFSVAHSITLALGYFDVLHPPSRWVEAGIAASVVLAATNNLLRILPLRDWIIAFAFGLIHGLGFATTLADLALAAYSKLAALAGFNLGVEIGQLLVVAAFLVTFFWMRYTAFYRHVVTIGGSLVIAGTGLIWLIERMFDVSLRL
jgi:hypothetical protein